MSCRVLRSLRVPSSTGLLTYQLLFWAAAGCMTTKPWYRYAILLMAVASFASRSPVLKVTKWRSLGGNIHRGRWSIDHFPQKRAADHQPVNGCGHQQGLDREAHKDYSIGSQPCRYRP